MLKKTMARMFQCADVSEMNTKRYAESNVHLFFVSLISQRYPSRCVGGWRGGENGGGGVTGPLNTFTF